MPPEPVTMPISALCRQARRGGADIGDVEHLLDRVRPQGAAFGEHRAVHRVVARQRAGVRRRGGGADLGVADLHDDDRLAGIGGLQQRRAQPRAVAARLEAAQMTCVSSSCARYSMHSATSTSASLPVATTRDSPSPRRSPCRRRPSRKLRFASPVRCEPARGRRPLSAVEKVANRPMPGLSRPSAPSGRLDE